MTSSALLKRLSTLALYVVLVAVISGCTTFSRQDGVTVAVLIKDADPRYGGTYAVKNSSLTIDNRTLKPSEQDSPGVFKLYGLAPGTYQVTASSPYCDTKSQTLVITPEQRSPYIEVRLAVRQRVLSTDGTGRMPDPRYSSEQTKIEVIDVMRRLIAAESRGESEDGQVAVAAVMLNRVLDSRFPQSLADVMTESGQFAPMTNPQEYLWNSLALDDYDLVLRRAHRAAFKAMAGSDPTSGALFFHRYDPVKDEPRPIGSTLIMNHLFLVSL